MSKEIAIYIRKEIHPSGMFSRFFLSTNKHSGGCWFNGLPPQKHGDGVEWHQSFNGQLGELLHGCKLSVGEYEIKIFYNQEYKTVGNCVIGEKPDKSASRNITGSTHLAPMKEEEILHFMKLFDNYEK